MSGRRHHEVAPGGNGETNRNHYEKDERKENRRNRVEKRKAAREHFRDERSEIREEIDMTRAGLPKRLHVQLATVQMLRVQLKDESIAFELPENYEEIKTRIEKLANGSDAGGEQEKLYEGAGTKSERRTAMRNDLQILRLTARGLRSSLRRHVNHVEETADHEHTPDIPVPPVNTDRPPRAPSKPSESVDLEDDKDKEDEEPEVPEPDGSDDPEPAPIPTPTVSEERSDTPPVTVPTVERTGDGHKDADETDEADDDRIPEEMKDPYLGVIADVPEKLRDDYNMPAEEANRFEDPKFKIWFEEQYTMEARRQIMDDLADGDRENRDGLNALLEAYEEYEKYEASLAPDDSSGLLEDKVKELNLSNGLGLTSSPIEGGIELSFSKVDTKIKLLSKGDKWILELNSPYDLIIKDGAELAYEDSERALLDARRLFREFTFVDEMLDHAGVVEEKFNQTPFTIDADGESITFHEAASWSSLSFGGDDTRNWLERGGDFQASHLVDIESVAHTLNTAYYSTNEDLPAPEEPELNDQSFQELITQYNTLVRRGTLTLSEDKKTLTLKDGDREFKSKLNGNIWSIDTPYPGLINDENDLNFDNSVKGIKRGLELIQYYSEWMNHIDKVVEDNTDKFTNPPSLSISPTGNLMSNGSTLIAKYEAGPDYYGRGVVSKENYTSALIGQIQLKVQNIAEENFNETANELARDKHRFEDTELSEETSSLSLKIGTNEILIKKVDDNWEMEIPSVVNGLTTIPILGKSKNLADLAEGFKSAATLLHAYNLAMSHKDSFNKAQIVEHGGPLFLKDTIWGDSAIRVSEDKFFKSTLGIAKELNRIQHSDINQFVQGFNESYLKEFDELRADIEAHRKKESEAPPDLGAVDSESSEIVDNGR